jgi:hypothetical protein
MTGTPGSVFDRVIPDTGADASALPWRDCQQLNLSAAQGRPGWDGGVAGGVTASLSYHIWISLERLILPAENASLAETCLIASIYYSADRRVKSS